jgi:shikimate dehydrogenase
LNVTVPHKQAAFALCTKLSDAATAAGAVNTISIAEDGLHGYNTDGIGLVRDLTVNLRRALAGKRIVVLGAGGAARGIVGPLLNEKPEELVVANRTKDRADEVAAKFADTVLVARAFEDLAYLRPFDIVINATSAGLKGDAPPFPPGLVGPRSFCYDLVYGSTDTPFVAWAKTHGADRAVHGWGMLVEQAAESFAIWRGVRPDTRALLKQIPR